MLLYNLSKCLLDDEPLTDYGHEGSSDFDRIILEAIEDGTSDLIDDGNKGAIFHHLGKNHMLKHHNISNKLEDFPATSVNLKLSVALSTPGRKIHQ